MKRNRLRPSILDSMSPPCSFTGNLETTRKSLSGMYFSFQSAVWKQPETRKQRPGSPRPLPTSRPAGFCALLSGPARLICACTKLHLPRGGGKAALGDQGDARCGKAPLVLVERQRPLRGLTPARTRPAGPLPFLGGAEMKTYRVHVIADRTCKNSVLRYVDVVTGKLVRSTKYTDPQTGEKIETGCDREFAKRLAIRLEDDLNAGLRPGAVRDDLDGFPRTLRERGGARLGRTNRWQDRNHV